MSDKYVIEYELEEGNKIFIEASDVQGLEKISNDRTSKAGETFDQALSHIKPVAEKLFGSIQEINNPKEIQLEFGVKFSAKAGVIFASADSEAAFKITLKWEN